MTDNNKVKLRVGYVGVTRVGDRVEITSKNTVLPDYPYDSDCGRTYCENGRYWEQWSREDVRDIVGPWVEPIDYNDRNWHRWEGGEMPVHRKTRVAVVLPYNTNPLEDRAGAFTWNHKSDPILSFRVVEEYAEPKEAREFWVSNNDGYAHDSLESVLSDPLTEKHGYIHVREVMD